jgi:hypothetical protein
MSDDFSDFNIDDISFGDDSDDAPDMLVGGAVGEEPPQKAAAPPADAKGEEPPAPKSVAPAEAAKSRAASAPETDGEADGEEPEQQEASEKKPREKTSLKTLVRLAVILLLLLLDATQLLGIVYRDTMEKRRVTSDAEAVFDGVKEALMISRAARVADMGFDVNQVEIGAGKAPAVAIAKPTPTKSKKSQPATPPPAIKTEKIAAPKPAKQAEAVASEGMEVTPPVSTKSVDKPKAAAEQALPKAKGTQGATAKQTTKATPAKTHAVAVGIFRSQRHANEMKKRLAKLSMPFFTEEVEKVGEGFIMLTKGGTPDKIKAAQGRLADNSYSSRLLGGELAAYFHYEDEAVKALALVSSTGLEGKVEAYIGKIPVLKLMAGPMTKPKARAASKKLTKAKIDNFVLRHEK